MTTNEETSMTRTWKPGDRALLPVTLLFRRPDTEPWWAVDIGSEADGYELSLREADLIPDDRRPSWLPGQPGDVALIAGEHRLRDKDGWWLSPEADAVVMVDDDVPADAVLVLPARTRGASPVVRVCECGHGAEEHDRGAGECYLCLPCRAYREVES